MYIDKQKLEKLDPNNVYTSISRLPDQIEQVIGDIESIDILPEYSEATLVAISGMGGSIYNYHVVNSLCYNDLTTPLVKVNDYDLPSYLSQKTLFIGSSYSGTTEETVATTREAVLKKMMTTAVTTGGELAALMDQHGLPYYNFSPMHNPSGQPRLGLGYMIFGPLLLLHKMRHVRFDIHSLQQAVDAIRDKDEVLQKQAFDLAANIKGKIIILITAEHLSGAVHVARNQLNETAKSFAEYHIIPELNHHLLEGLTYPENTPLHFLFYESGFFGEKNRKRMKVTQDVLTQQNKNFTAIAIDAKDQLEEFLQIVQINSYLSFFLAMEHNLDPSEIPWVDYFKEKMKS